jgi:phosphoglycerate dehydrogenase-like enzyme
MTKTPRLLIHADRASAERIVAQVEGHLPGTETAISDSYAGLAAAMAAFHPNVVYSIVFDRDTYPRDVLFAEEKLTWVHVSGAGINHLVPWDPEHIAVTNAGGIQDDGMAQFAFARLFAINCNFFTYHDQQKAHVWAGHDNLNSVGGTLTVVGLGKIGRACARLGAKLGMTVYGVRARPEPCEAVAEVVPPDRLNEVLAKSDYVIVVTPLTAATRGLIGPDQFAAMKPGAILHNMARGHVVDENALMAALNSGHLRAASLDVFSEEPLPASSPLWDTPNLHMTPHIGGMLTHEEYDRLSTQVFLENLDRWRTGEPLDNVCDPVRGY